jgi:hypothetical protein
VAFVPIEKSLVFILPGLAPGRFQACDPVQGEPFKAAENAENAENAVSFIVSPFAISYAMRGYNAKFSKYS